MIDISVSIRRNWSRDLVQLYALCKGLRTSLTDSYKGVTFKGIPIPIHIT
jgi:hypothetical protein